MLPTLFVTFAVLTLSTPPPRPAPSPAVPRGATVARTVSAGRSLARPAAPAQRNPPSPRNSSPPESAWSANAARSVRPDDLYSLRARRRFASYLRMRLLELRKEGLERAADVIEHRLPVDALPPDP